MAKNPPANEEDGRDTGAMPGSGRVPGEANGNPRPYSCLENPMDRGAWRAIVYRVTRVGYNLATKLPPPYSKLISSRMA